MWSCAQDEIIDQFNSEISDKLARFCPWLWRRLRSASQLRVRGSLGVGEDGEAALSVQEGEAAAAGSVSEFV
jgi:hypothetical protein